MKALASLPSMLVCCACVAAVLAAAGGVALAEASLEWLENDATAVDALDSAVRAALIDRQLRPCPRLYAGPVLGRLGATAMVDVSDGLARDLGHVAEMSDVAITCDARMVPVQTGVAAVESASAPPA